SLWLVPPRLPGRGSFGAASPLRPVAQFPAPLKTAGSLWLVPPRLPGRGSFGAASPLRPVAQFPAPLKSAGMP
ncbi:hypothetical protein AB0C88_36340, partial [Streptomyces chartreusis]|uniref:hypothetical protein n=1 Tax=Streptomyces chartreusis TaxID=1969 RepID=UPI0033D58D5C